MRCIDADKLKDKLYSLVDCDGNERLHIDVVIDVIDNEPDVDVLEQFTIMNFYDRRKINHENTSF